ncbi:MAG: peptide-methionine (R)-S-oxide reductase [Pseudomonadaceae bacterium]|nr:MAG: peptide-methionine (R)-S-oxide reductase [Pseudomonadaceae bacterium]
MNRRTLLQTLALLPLLPVLRVLANPSEATLHMIDIDFTPLDLDHDFWRDKVSADAWHILFEEGTEPAGSSPLDDIYDPGTYICAACYLPLFRSDDKYDSKTGWPSFTQPIEGTMGTKRDFKLIWPRTEYHCARCGGHQGHVFNDGPSPRGERWCNNGLALHFVPANEHLPNLRG